jgi:hypothetical protein
MRFDVSERWRLIFGILVAVVVLVGVTIKFVKDDEIGLRSTRPFGGSATFRGAAAGYLYVSFMCGALALLMGFLDRYDKRKSRHRFYWPAFLVFFVAALAFGFLAGYLQ